MEFSGDNNFIIKKRIEAISDSIKKYYDGIEISETERRSAHSGLRPVSPDGLPFIGKTIKYKNLIIASGHGMMGWSLGLITGKLVAQIIFDIKPLVNLTPLSPDRFKKH